MTDLSGTVENGVHVFPVRVYYEDTDAAGIVYYANYLKFAERGRTEMMRLMGHMSSTALDRDGVMLAVRRCEVDYLCPARLDDRLEIHTRITETQRASLWLKQVVRRDDTDLARFKVRLACVTRAGRAARFPESVRATLTPASTPADRNRATTSRERA